MLENSESKIFYGRHFYPGVAEYSDTGTRVLIKEDVIRKMDASFAGKPVFVGHVGDEINKLSIDELKKIKDGTVIRSFYNEADGSHWVEFMIESQKGLDAIANGYRLSNAYTKLSTDPTGGLYSGQNYSEEVLDAAYHHLGLVTNPRYNDSVVMDVPTFKKFNEEKKAELRLQNSLKEEPKKLESKMPFNFFKKTKVENAPDLEGLSVLLKNRGEVMLTDLIKEADVKQVEIKDQIILVNEEKDERMTIEEAVKEIKNLRNKCNELEEKLAAKNEDDKDKKDNEDDKEAKNEDDKEKKNEDDKKEDDKDKEDNECDKQNEDDKKEDDKEKQNEDDKDKDDKKIEKNFLNEILNAQQICENAPAMQDVLLPADRAKLAQKYF